MGDWRWRPDRSDKAQISEYAQRADNLHMTGLLPILNIDSSGEYRRSVVLWAHVWPFLWFFFIVIHFILLFSYGDVEAELGVEKFEMRGWWWHLHTWHDAASSRRVLKISGPVFSFLFICILFSFAFSLTLSASISAYFVRDFSLHFFFSLSLIQPPLAPPFLLLFWPVCMAHLCRVLEAMHTSAYA